jgi:RNA polymerase sigma factor (sigma-70 family)
MSAAPNPAAIENKKNSWADDRLVRACRKGDEEAWSALIDRYKNLIFSIPIKYGLSRDDAADVFQSVCVDFLRELPNLREIKALPKWLIQISAHTSLRRKQHQEKLITTAVEELETLSLPEKAVADDLLHEAQQEQALRNAVAKLSPRCRELVHMLFYETPPRPYGSVAAQLGLAPGSIGFIRGRCLEKLRRSLKEAGFDEP